MTHIITIIYRTPHFRFYFIDSQVNTDFLPNFAFFTVKSPSATQRSVYQENALKKSKNVWAFFFRKPVGSNNYFILIENNSRFLR